MFCNYCRSPNPNDSRYCSSCGEDIQLSDRSRASTQAQDLKLPADLPLIRATFIIHDETNRLWSIEDVQGTREWLLKRHKSIPTLQELHTAFGRNVVDAEIESCIRERENYLATIEKIIEIDAAFTKCHICGSTHKTVRRDFGLAEVLVDKRNWAETAVSVAISVVTLPTLGVGRISFPGRTRRLRVLKLHLILCDACMREKTTALLWDSKLTAADYARHPAWEVAQQLGFVKILTAKELAKITTGE
jgi:hypothetical protein